MVNDIIEVRSNGTVGAEIFIHLINDGMRTQLVGFGKNASSDFIKIGGNGQNCTINYESARFLQIQNGIILKSQCISEYNFRFEVSLDSIN